MLGQHDAAIDKLQASIALFEAHGPYIARTLHAKYLLLTAVTRAMSDVAAYTYPPDYRQLAERWQTFAVEAAAHGMGRLHAMGLGNTAIATHHLGDAPLAISQLREALVRQSSFQLGPYCAATLCHIGAAHAKVGEIDEAVRAYERFIEQYCESNPRHRERVTRAVRHSGIDGGCGQRAAFFAASLGR